MNTLPLRHDASPNRSVISYARNGIFVFHSLHCVVVFSRSSTTHDSEKYTAAYQLERNKPGDLDRYLLQCTDVTLHTTLDFLTGSKHNSKLTILKRQNVNIVDWDVYYDFS